MVLVFILLHALLMPLSQATSLAQALPAAQSDDTRQPQTYRLEADTLVRVDLSAGETPGPIAAARVQNPKLTHSIDPKFPPRGERGSGGLCTLSVVVGLDGKPHDIAVLTSLSPQYDSNAIAALAKYRFKPATLDGRPTAVKITVEMSFTLH